jgi:hypothetical protein
MYRVIKSPENCYLLQIDIDSVQDWCAYKYMELNISETEVLQFSRKINMSIYEYKFY